VRTIFRELVRDLCCAIVLGVTLAGMAYYAGHTGNHNGATTFGEAVPIALFFASVGAALAVLKACTRAVGTRLRRHRPAR
jgi:hypothetical protein